MRVYVSRARRGGSLRTTMTIEFRRRGIRGRTRAGHKWSEDGAGDQRQPEVHLSSDEVETSSDKGGALSKNKVIGRRSVQESQWLDDLVLWLSKVSLKAEDQILTRYKSKTAGGKIFKRRLTAEMIREATKDMATASGLPRGPFSSHSLRKGGMT